MESFSITIQFTAEDLQKAYRIHFRKGNTLRGRLLLILALISFGIGIVLLLYSYIALQFDNWFAWFLVVYGMLLLFLFFWRFNTMGKRMFRKMPDFKHPWEYTFSLEGVKATGKTASSENSWAHYVKGIITEDMILLYPNRFRFSFFDKQHFTDEQFAQLKDWARRFVEMK
jgi:hypothetical protein